MQPLKVEELSPNELNRVISKHLGREKCLGLSKVALPSVGSLGRKRSNTRLPFSQDKILAWQLLKIMKNEVQSCSIVPSAEGYECSLLTLDGECFTYKSSEQARAIAVVAVEYIVHKNISDNLEM